MAEKAIRAKRGDRLRIGGHDPVAAAADHQAPSGHAGGRTGGKQQAGGRTNCGDRHDPPIGLGGPVCRAQETALQHPAEVALGIVEILATAAQPCRARDRAGQLQGRGRAPGVANHHHLGGADGFEALEAAGRDGIQAGGDIQGPQPQFCRSGRGHLAEQHGLLLAAVTAGVPGQDHGVAMAGQVLAPTLETLGAIPEAVGDHHQFAVGALDRLQNDQLQGLGTVAHSQDQLLAPQGQGPRFVKAGIDTGGGLAGHQLLGPPLLVYQPFGHLQGLVGIEGHALARQSLEQGQQAGLALGEELVQGFGQHLARLARAELLRIDAVNSAEGGHHQQHLLNQGLGYRLVHHCRALQGQGRLEQPHQGAAQGPVTGAIQLGQITVTRHQRRRTGQFAQAQGEARLQRR